MKKVLSVIITVLLVLAALTPAAVFAFEPTARLYNVYGDGMLFRQNKEAVFSGCGATGTDISVYLFDKNGNGVAKGKGYASRKGTFRVSFTAPQASYDEYTVKLYENGELFRELKNVVFGELFLASGQSNMQYGLPQDYYICEGLEKIGENARWIRAALVPPISSYNGSTEYCPADPRREIENVRWTDGTTDDFYANISAVAYYFANKLQKDLDIPVGIINSSLGGSSINTWLPREVIEYNEQVKNILVSHDAYIPYESWSPEKINQGLDMTSNFNSKIYAFQGFSLSGIIWYQGETEVINNYTPEEYTVLLSALQSSYTDFFGNEDGLIPLIYTHIASYFYHSIFDVPAFNEAIAAIADRAEKRACVSIYDVGLEFSDLGAIHPAKKKPVGERMAYAAENLIYGDGDCFTAATVSSSEIKDGAVYVKFNNTGDGLAFDGREINGCTVCGENGVYVPAKAKLVSSDTVKIFSAAVKNPVSACYAYCLDNGESDLYSTDENGKAMPVSPFVTDKKYNKYAPLEQWAACEKEKSWHSDSTDGLFDTWKGNNCDISFTSAAAESGDAGLEIKGRGLWSISPVRKFKDGIKNVIFYGSKTDYSDIETVSFMVKNTGEKDVTLTDVKFYTSAVSWFVPKIGEGGVSRTVPADGRWHEISLSLNSLYLYGNKGGAAYTNNRLDNVTDIKFCFSGSGTVCFDSITFAPETEDKDVSFAGSFESADNIIEYFCAIFTEIINGFIALIKG